MSVFDLTDFERQGNVENDVHFTSLDEAKELLSQLIGSALRTIQIYTPDLEPTLYNNQAFVDGILAMSRGNRHAQIQILALDTTSAAHHGHAILRLAHQLTSTIEIKIPSEEYQEENLAYILVDKKGFIFRADSNTSEGIYNPDCKYRSNKLSEIFTMAWDHADVDPETRRLSI